MKTLKYGLTLMLGLGMLGFSARLQAQASGQTADVVPANAQALPDVPQMQVQGAPAQQAEEQPQRGIPTPKAIEALMDKQDYETAVKEFDKFIKTAKGNGCTLNYLRYTFYSRLQMEDREHAADYQAKRQAVVADMEQQCPDMPETYIAKTQLYGDGKPDSVVVWMDKAIEFDQTLGMCYSMRADALWLLQEDEKACADYKKAVELNDQPSKMRYMERCANRVSE